MEVGMDIASVKEKDESVINLVMTKECAELTLLALKSYQRSQGRGSVHYKNINCLVEVLEKCMQPLPILPPEKAAGPSVESRGSGM